MTEETIQEELQQEMQSTPLDQALKDSRMAAGFSIDDMALKLNLPASVIKNLETDLEKVIEDEVYPLIYLRGYLINYSKALHFPDVESYSEYQKLSHPSESVTTLQNPYVFTEKKKISKKIIWLGIILFIAAMGTIVYFGETSKKVDEATSETVVTENVKINLPSPVVETTNETEIEKVVSEVVVVEESVVEEPVEVIEAEEFVAVPEIEAGVVINSHDDTKKPLSVEPTTQEAVVVTPIVEPVVVETPAVVETVAIEKAVTPATIETLKLVFAEECWAVITDSKGKRLAFGLYQSGKELDLAGVPPFALKLGNPTAVDIYYQDKLIERTYEEGKMADFSLPQ